MVVNKIFDHVYGPKGKTTIEWLGGVRQKYSQMRGLKHIHTYCPPTVTFQQYQQDDVVRYTGDLMNTEQSEQGHLNTT